MPTVLAPCFLRLCCGHYEKIDEDHNVTRVDDSVDYDCFGRVVRGKKISVDASVVPDPEEGA